MIQYLIIKESYNNWPYYISDIAEFHFLVIVSAKKINENNG